MVLSVVTLVSLASRDEGDSRVAPRAGGREPTGTHQDGLHQPPLGQGRAVHPGDVLQRGQRGLRVPGGDVEPSGFGDELGADDKGHGNRKRRGPRGRGRHRATRATVPAPADGTDVAREEARNERGLGVLVAVPARVTVGLTPRFTPVWLEPLVNTVKF